MSPLNKTAIKRRFENAFKPGFENLAIDAGQLFAVLTPKHLGRMAIAFAAIIYGIGFTVHNIFLSGMGVAQIGLLKGNYIITGVCVLFSYLLLVATIATIGCLFWWCVEKTATNRYYKVLQFCGIISLVLLLTTISLFLGIGPRQARWAMASTGLLVFSFCSLLWMIGTYGRTTNFTGQLKVGVFALSIVTVPFSLVYYAERVHPTIAPSLGGGRPLGISLWLDKDGEAVEYFLVDHSGGMLTLLEGNMLPGRVVRISEANVYKYKFTPQAVLMYADPKSLVVLDENGRAITYGD